MVRKILIPLVLIALLSCSSDKATNPDKMAIGGNNDEPQSSSDKATNSNKMVIGGNNDDPQMGLFVLSVDDATRVDAKLETDAKAAYALAKKLAVQKAAGDRTFCEDAVRMTIGYLGIDGMLNDSKRETWKTAEFDILKAKHMDKINELHETMMEESAPELCESTLHRYVEQLRFAANEDLAIRNFGY